MADETKNTPQEETQKPEFEVTEIAADDLDNVAGGLITTFQQVDGCEGCDGCGTCMN